MLKFLTPCAFAVASLFAFTAADAAPNMTSTPPDLLFQNGDRWTVIGDSITQGGTYYEWVWLYYLTRFPDRKIVVSNAGNSGDSASGGVLRYDWDIHPNKPTVATLMFGMNDVRRENYGVDNVTPEIAATRAAALEDYRKNTTVLARRLKADGARLIFLTPTIYDEHMVTAMHNLTGVNDALGRAGDLLPAIAKETGGTIIDLHHPMDAVNKRIQALDPKLTLVRFDRVHPITVGHFVMAYIFLKAQGAPALVSSITLDASGSKVTESLNATTSNVSFSNGDLKFTVAEKALPYPTDKEWKPALEWVPFTDELNREMLRVTNLPTGVYQLLIDGAEVQKYDASALAAGVNLALENTPQAKLSAHVLELVEQWHQLLANDIRVIAQFEFWRLGDLPHPISLEAVRPRIDPIMAKLKSSTTHEDAAELNFYERYVAAKPNEAQNQAKLAALVDQIYAANQPQPHVWELKQIQP
jgi:lysophospholipase L1-like esterase